MTPGYPTERRNLVYNIQAITQALEMLDVEKEQLLDQFVQERKKLASLFGGSILGADLLPGDLVRGRPRKIDQVLEVTKRLVEDQPTGPIHPHLWFYAQGLPPTQYYPPRHFPIMLEDPYDIVSLENGRPL